MENKIYGRVYLITNKINGKQYVGQTIRTIKKRFKSHYIDSKYKKTYVGRAINKYGKENFIIEEINVAYNKKELKILEGKYIEQYKTLVPNGYNLTDIINGGGKLSQQTKQKLKQKANTPERLKLASKQGKNNRGRNLGGKSKYCGVCIKDGKYLSAICINSKRNNLGSYKEESDAAKAYDIAAIKYYGNDSVLNFPELRQDYINGKITVNKNTHQDNSKSGVKGVYFNRNRWHIKYFDNITLKEKYKSFQHLNDAIKFKTNY